MGGLFGVASRTDCVFDLFFGTDYHSHLGTRRGGMAVYGEKGFDRSIHNIENSPFRTKFEKESVEMHGNLGIGCISDNEPQPLMVRSHLGTFAITTVGRINNSAELVESAFEKGNIHFLEMSGGSINPTELVAALINQQQSIVDGHPLCPERDRRIHDHADYDAAGNLCSPGQGGPYAAGAGQKERSGVRLFRKLCFYQPGL